VGTFITVKVWKLIEEGVCQITVQPADRVPPKDAEYIRTIKGIDWEDCMKQHHWLMGWDPYVPQD
jgi:hypothetical protein